MISGGGMRGASLSGEGIIQGSVNYHEGKTFGKANL
jgi:hypothetical protein